MVKIENQQGRLIIYEHSNDYYEESDEFPIEIDHEEATGIVEIPGIGKNVSLLVHEMCSLPWVDKPYLNEVIKYLKRNFPDSKISWEETSKYLEGNG